MTNEIVLTKEETEARNLAIGALHNAMQGLANAIIECDDCGIPLSDAFEAIGMEIPKIARPMINLLADKLPSRNPDFVRNDT